MTIYIRNLSGSLGDYTYILKGFSTLGEFMTSGIMEGYELHVTENGVSCPIKDPNTTISSLADPKLDLKWELTKQPEVSRWTVVDDLIDEIERIIVSTNVHHEVKVVIYNRIFDSRSQVTTLKNKEKLLGTHFDNEYADMVELLMSIRDGAKTLERNNYDTNRKLPERGPQHETSDTVSSFRSQFTDKDWLTYVSDVNQRILGRQIVNLPTTKCAKCDTMCYTGTSAMCSCRNVSCCSDTCYFDIIRKCFKCKKRVCVMCKAFHPCFRTYDTSDEAFDRCT